MPELPTVLRFNESTGSLDFGQYLSWIQQLHHAYGDREADAIARSEFDVLPSESFTWPIRMIGRLAQLVRAPALQAGGRRFESCTAHHQPLGFRSL